MSLHPGDGRLKIVDPPEIGIADRLISAWNGLSFDGLSEDQLRAMSLRIDNLANTLRARADHLDAIREGIALSLSEEFRKLLGRAVEDLKASIEEKRRGES